ADKQVGFDASEMGGCAVAGLRLRAELDWAHHRVILGCERRRIFLSTGVGTTSCSHAGHFGLGVREHHTVPPERRICCGISLVRTSVARIAGPALRPGWASRLGSRGEAGWSRPKGRRPWRHRAVQRRAIVEALPSDSVDLTREELTML